MRYRSLRVFSLGGWSPLLPTGFPVSRGTLVQPDLFTVSPTRLSRSLGEFPKLLRLPFQVPLWLPATPPCMHDGLGSLPFARRYLGDRSFFLFLRLLRCFSSAAYLRMTMDSSYGAQGLPVRVSPFGHLRINGYLLLPEAFRSLSRPSSALSAKASTLRPSCLTFCGFINDKTRSPSCTSVYRSGSRYMNECFVKCYFAVTSRCLPIFCVFWNYVFSFQGTWAGNKSCNHCYGLVGLRWAFAPLLTFMGKL